MMGMGPQDKDEAIKNLSRSVGAYRSEAEGWHQRFESAVERIDHLEQIILKLQACYQWDRAEYQSNKELVAEVEKAMVGVRRREPEAGKEKENGSP